MTERPNYADSPLPVRGCPTKGFAWQDNELYVAFQPIIGPSATWLYCQLSARSFGSSFTFSLRKLASETKKGRTTLWCALAVLKHIGMVVTHERGGCQETECSLVDLKELARRLGASYNRKAVSYVFSSERSEDLRADVAQLMKAMQSKPATNPQSPRKDSELHFNPTESHLILLDSERDAGVFQKGRWQSSDGTQVGPHLIREKSKNENTSSPNLPFHAEAQQKRDSIPGKEPHRGLLRWAQDVFTGVMKDMGDDLLDTSEHPHSRFANGFAEWERFGFASLAVESATSQGESLSLVLSARNPEETRKGLLKYEGKWNASLRKWYDCEVQVHIQARERFASEWSRKGDG
jgi:hypothetical protein